MRLRLWQVADACEQAASEYRDMPWMVLFYLHVLAVAIVAATLGRTALADAANCVHGAAGSSDDAGASLEASIASFMPQIVKMLVIGAGIAFVLSIAMIFFVKQFAQCLITCMLYMFVGIYACATV